MQITPLVPGLAAQLDGIDLRAVDANAFAAIHAVWLDHPVLRIRGQQLDDAQLQRFSAFFGPLERAPLGNISEAERQRLGDPRVTVISNIIENGRPIGGLGALEANWHSDMSYVPEPPTASILYAVEIPPTGGDTHFANQYAALARLPAELRDQVATLHIHHDAAHASVGGLRRGFTAFDDPREAPGVDHPAVRVHPQTGRPALFLGRREFASIPELDRAASEQLLDAIWAHATHPADCFTQHWQVGDVVIWDNRCVLHRRDAFDPQARRLLKRTQVLARDAAA